MISKFSEHAQKNNESKQDTIVIAFGRMNPPTIGHGVLVDAVVSEAQQRNADHLIFTGKTQDSKKNPLSHTQKVTYLEKFFPQGKFPLNTEGHPYGAVLHACSLGYKNIVMVAGSDQVEEFKQIEQYQGKVAMKDPKKRTYSFESFEVVQAGEVRVEQCDGSNGVTASKIRKAAFGGDFDNFAAGIPGSDINLKMSLYTDVRRGLGLTENYLPEQKSGQDDVTILALTSSEKDLSDTVEKMQSICKRRKIKFHAIKTSKAQIEISGVASNKIIIKNYDGEENDITIVPGNTVAVVRGGVMNSDIGVAIITILQNNGVFMINERGGMELCANKLETAIALKKHNLPHPRTAFVCDEANIESAVKEIGGKFPVIVKTLTGAEGIGVSKIDSMESLKSVLQTLWKYGAEVIMQEFLPDFKNDVRSIVLNGKIFACAKRDKAPKDFRTNIARGSKGGAMQLTDEEIKLVEQAARVSKCYYVGIDHVINDGKPYIIEMNASPGSGNIYYRYYEQGKGKNNVKGEELVEDLVEYIINRAHWKLFSNLAVREPVTIDGVEYTAKIDTGNSGYNMIHAENIKDNGNHTVTFKLPSGKKTTKKIISRITVKSGIGKKTRLVVLMDIDFHGKKYPNIKFSLGDRSHMSSRVLMGLQFLSKTGLMVDPSEAIYPQPEVGTKRKSEEEEEEEIVEMPTQTAVDATKDLFRSANVTKKLFTLANKKRTMTSAEFKEECKKTKNEIMIQAHTTTNAVVTLNQFAQKSYLGKFITKLFDKLMQGGMDIPDVNILLHKIAYMAHMIPSFLGMGDEVDGNPVLEDWERTEIEDALAMLNSITTSKMSIKEQVNRTISLEQKALSKGNKDASDLYRLFIEYGKNQMYESHTDSSDPITDIEFLLWEVSPPAGAARRFSKKARIKQEFQKRYGSRWKEVFYATAWKMHNDSYEPDLNMVDNAISKIHSKIVAEGSSWAAKANEKRGPLGVGTDKIAKTYRQDTPGQRERLKEETPEQEAEKERGDTYKQWSKLVNMSSKELSNFIDSDEGKEAGLSRKESGKAGSDGGKITSGRDSARAIVRMLDRSKDKWTDNDWKWAGKQINFINRMKGAKGAFRENDGTPTRKLLALKIWGHNPEKR